MHGHMNVKKHKLRSGVRCVVEGGRSLKLEVDEGGVYDAETRKGTAAVDRLQTRVIY